MMKKLLPVLLLSLFSWGEAVVAQPTVPQGHPFDLFSINGRGLCLSKGRFQDQEYNPDSKVMQEIIDSGKKAIPRLIEMIADETAKPGPAILCFWPQTIRGDLAHLVLANLFLDPTWTQSTVPRALYDAELESRYKDSPGWELHRAYLKKYGRKKLQSRWREIWSQFEQRVEWDGKDRYFRLKK